jgi:branched-chain amino acid transport system substrate-binding protein
MRLALALAAAMSISVAPYCAAQSAEPIKIGITTILSGPFADRGQSEQYGAQLAMDRINAAGGVLGRRLEAYYADNSCKPDIGVPATKRLLEQVKVPVVIGALCTPVTRAILPIMAAAKTPLIIATSAGHEFVDPAGVGGNDYLFKTIPSDVDIARGLVKYLVAQHVTSIAMVGEALEFQQLNAQALEDAANAAGIKITTREKVAATGTDFAAVIRKIKEGNPDAVMLNLAGATGEFFKAFEISGWKIPVGGRVDLAAASGAVSKEFAAADGLANLTSIAVFTPAQNAKPVQDFITAYRERTGLMPTQRSFFVYEAVYLAADAIRRAGKDTPDAIQKALKTTKMPSALGGTYVVDDHNHSHTPLFIMGLKDGKPVVVATE